MEWHLAQPDERALLDLRHAVSMFLRARVQPGQDLSAAQLAYDELVRNARDHAGGPVQVEVDCAGARPVLGVRDEGPGFTPVQACRDRPRGGLHVLAHAVGPVHVEPAHPRGSRVCVELPLDLRARPEPRCPFGGSHEVPSPRAAHPIENERPSPSTPSVVIAADDPDVRAELVRLVASAGFAVTSAGERAQPLDQQAAFLGVDTPAMPSVRRVDDLTDRQLEVLALMAEGLSNSAIAAELVITKRAVEKHVTLILERLWLQDDDHHDRRVVAARLYLAAEGARPDPS